jgi:hypothetical protein
MHFAAKQKETDAYGKQSRDAVDECGNTSKNGMRILLVDLI